MIKEGIVQALQEVFSEEDYDLHKALDDEGAYEDVAEDFIAYYEEWVANNAPR